MQFSHIHNNFSFTVKMFPENNSFMLLCYLFYAIWTIFFIASSEFRSRKNKRTKKKTKQKTKDERETLLYLNFFDSYSEIGPLFDPSFYCCLLLIFFFFIMYKIIKSETVFYTPHKPD